MTVALIAYLRSSGFKSHICWIGQHVMRAAMRVSTAALAVFSSFFISSRIAAAFCFASAGDAYRIDPLLLQAIATVESGLRPDAVHHNTNGTRDIGLMQINSVHLPHLRSRGIDQQQLLQDPCLSVMVGAEILARFISRHGYGWQAVGAYNAGSASGRALARQRYIARVWSRYVRLLDRKPYRRPNAYSPDATPSSATKAQIPRPAGITQKTLEYAPCRRDNSTSNTHGVGKSGMFQQRSAAMT